MRINRRRGLALAIGLLAVVTVQARSAVAQEGPPSRQEKKRNEILKELGLKKKPSPAVPPPGSDPAAPAPAGESPTEGSDTAAATGKPSAKDKDKSGGAKSGAPAAAAAPSFRKVIHPQLLSTCKACHSPGGAAAGSHLLFSGDAAADRQAVARFVDAHNPEGSAVLAKVTGNAPHGGGALWPAAGAPYLRLLAWIRGGARLDGAQAAEAVAEPGTPRAGAPAPRAPKVAGSQPVAAAVGSSTEAERAPAAPAESGPIPPAPVISLSAASPSPSSFASGVHPILMKACAACHGRAGAAALTRLVLTGDAAADEAAARVLVDMQAPDRSPLVAKASGQMHGGGPVLPVGDPRLEVIVAWVRGLAAPAAVATVAAPGVTVAAPGAGSPAAPSVVAVPAAGHDGEPNPLQLPLGFRLNGRFDLNYERRQFSGNPFASSSVAGLRSYHHFLFLSRDVAGDPCGLSVEILTQQFWEAHCRVPGLPSPARLSVAAGKIVVPFGADPLYHQSYGGLAGFDQRILPVIWAVEGVAAHLVLQRRAFVLTDDLYLVRGYALARADAVINLQNDFSPVDVAKVGLGNRLGAAWMFVSAWYSSYFNPLGFGRRLFMQAVDLTVWRPRGIPVAEHFSLGAGLLRADVSGGGPGVGGPGMDYYDFGSYFQLRYHPTDWLYIQYREGLRTFNNRRGVIADNSRLTNADGSTHSFGVVARHGGLSAGLYYFINLEKVDEVPDDLLRLNVVYEF